MAFGIKADELNNWKLRVQSGQITYLTHYWYESRFPGINTVTKVGCANLDTLTKWCELHGLNAKYIHKRKEFPHFDLIGPKQKEILYKEELWDQIRRFKI